MAVLFNGTTISGSDNDDIILGYPGEQGNVRNQVVDGRGGDDLIYGDYDFFLTGDQIGTSRLDPDTPNLTDLRSLWGRGENPDVIQSTGIAHASVIIQGTGQAQWMRLDLRAGQQLAVDVDYGNSPLGNSFDSRLQLVNAAGTTALARNDNSEISSGALGSTSTLDSFMRVTVQQTGTYYVRLTDARDGGTGVPNGATAVLNFTLTNFGQTADPVGGADRLSGGTGNDRIYGQLGNDTINGDDGVDTMYGGAGRDRLDGGEGDDVVFGGGGNDRFITGAGQLGDNVYGGSGRDTLDLSLTDTGRIVNLAAGTHVIRDGFNGGGQDFAVGGIETVFGSQASDGIVGNERVNLLLGLSGNDAMSGRGGADRLDGGFGNDVLTGGAGADTFQFAAGRDRITDFANNLDTLALDDALWGGVRYSVEQVLRIYARDVGSDIVFTFEGGQTLRIEDFATRGDLANDIVFV